MIYSLRLLCALLITSFAFGSVSASSDGIPTFQSGALTVRPIGRMLIDGAFFMPGGDGLDAGVAMPDIRNKYVSARLRYSYTNVVGSDVCANRHVNAIQGRIQIIF